jgi:hypothetical protein
MKKLSNYGGIEEDLSPKSMMVFFVVGFLLSVLPLALTI